MDVPKVAQPKKLPGDKTPERLDQLEQKVGELIAQAELMIEEVVRATIRSNRAIAKVHELNGKYARVRR